MLCSVVKNPPASAKDTGAIPGSGEIPRAVEQLSPGAMTMDLTLSSPGAHVSQLLQAECPRAHDLQEKSSHGERPEQHS